jgi:O-antigen ligase
LRAVVSLAILMLLLPFEPMAPLFRAFGLQLSLLETAAAVLLLIAAVASPPTRRVPLSGLVALLLAAFLVSALSAAEPSLLPLKFTLRMAAGALAFLIAARALSHSPRFSLLFACLSIAGALTALLALLETGSASVAEPLVAPFREHAFEVGGRPRVAATFAYPNTAGGFLALALAPTLYFVREERYRILAAIAGCALTIAILLTYSRGALLGAAASAVTLGVLVRSPALFRIEALLLAITASFFALEPAFRWRAYAEGDRSWYEARIEPRAETLDLAVRELTTTPVRITNQGKLTWGSKGSKPFHLSYRWFHLEGESDLQPLPMEGERTTLQRPLAPGESVELAAIVRAPDKPGAYVLVWDMVHEHTTWFSDKVGLGEPVNVAVGLTGKAVKLAARADLRTAVAYRSWRPGRSELWGIALQLFRAHPLLGVGPDNFRWLYGPASGHSTWDTRVFSNSLYLELLSTVGLAGFAAFVFLIAKALSGLRKRAREGPFPIEAAVLIATLAGFLVHGFFDYLLAFTPIYLAVFVLLGASSALIRGKASGGPVPAAVGSEPASGGQPPQRSPLRKAAGVGPRRVDRRARAAPEAVAPPRTDKGLPA